MTDAWREMGHRAFGWMIAHEPEFFAHEDRARLKHLGELALISGSLLDDHADARGLLDRAWAGLDGGERIAQALESWPIAATTYVPFLIAGVRSRALEARFAEPGWLHDHAKLPPFVRFAVGVALELLGIARPWNDGEVVLANRFFEPPVAGASAVRAVLLSHAIMWRTEMGRYPAGLDAGARALYGRVSPRWHAALQAARALDPLGEIVIADALAGLPPQSASLALLCDAQRKDGAMPPFSDDSVEDFAELYHPTCVAALAGTFSARGGRSQSPAG